MALTQRAKRVLAEVRDDHLHAVDPVGTVIIRAARMSAGGPGGDPGQRHSRRASLPLTDSIERPDDASLAARSDVTREMWKEGTLTCCQRLCLPDVDQQALAGLKFSEALPERLATATLAARLTSTPPHGASLSPLASPSLITSRTDKSRRRYTLHPGACFASPK